MCQSLIAFRPWCLVLTIGVFVMGGMGVRQSAALDLVVNGGFETYSQCPSNFGNIADATGWSDSSLGSPDFFHSCCGNSTFGTPTNGFGTEAPLSGEGYAHIRVYGNLPSGHPSGDYREYLQGSLSSPMIANVTYNVSFYVSRVELSAQWAISDLGVYFSPTSTSVAHDKIINVTPQVVNTGGFLTAGSGWTLVSGTYTAVGGEQYFIIGNFETDAATNATFTGGGCCPVASYYVDDVAVEFEVPEPTSWILMAAGGLAVLLWRRRRQSVPELNP